MTFVVSKCVVPVKLFDVQSKRMKLHVSVTDAVGVVNMGLDVRI